MASVFTPVQKKPSHQTVLSTAEPPPDLRNETFMQRWRNSAGFKKRMQQLHEGTLPAHKVKIVDARIIAMGATRLNKNQSTNYAKRYMQGAPGQQSLVREINNAATLNQDGYDDHEPNEGALDKAYSHIAKLQREGAIFHAATGLGIGLPIDDHVNLIDDDGHVIVNLPEKTARALAKDPKLQPGFQLFQMAYRGETPPDINAAANAALDVVGQDRKFGDAWLFKSREDRLDSIRDAFAALRTPNIGDKARRLASQSLAMALLAEALPHKQAHQMLMDMIPLLGNYRAAEDAMRSGKAALEALERGDEAEAAALMGETFMHVIGALGGVATSAAAASSKSVKATVTRKVEAHKNRKAEKTDPEAKDAADGARRRAEGMANRSVGRQLTGEEWAKFDQITSGLPSDVVNSIRSRLYGTIGAAGEDFFEEILRRWKPRAVSEAKIREIQRSVVARLFGDPSAKVQQISEALDRVRNGKRVRADVILDDVVIEWDNGRIIFKDIETGSNLLEVGIDIKTGKLNESQDLAYRENSRSEKKFRDEPQTLEDYAYIHVRPEEWRLYIARTIKEKFRTLSKKKGMSREDVAQIEAQILDMLDVADFQKWTNRLIAEFLIVGVLRQPET